MSPIHNSHIAQRSVEQAAVDAVPEQIRILVNGNEESVALGLSVAELLASLGLSGDGIAVALNDRIVVRSAHGSQLLAAGDRIEIVHAVAGG